MSSMGDRKAALNLAAVAALSTLSFGCARGVTPEKKETLESVQPVARAFADVAMSFEQTFGVSRDWAAALAKGSSYANSTLRSGSAEQIAAFRKAAADLVAAIDTMEASSQSSPKQAR